MDDPTDVLYERPGVTGLLLGIVLLIGGDLSGAGNLEGVALLLFAFGTVVALYNQDWWRPAGQALSVAGGFVLLVQVVRRLF